MKPWTDINAHAAYPALLIADHASNEVPAGISLGIPAALLNEHIALDIGVADLGAMLCAALTCPGILGGVSRLVIDLNREEDADHIIPTASDGHDIPGNHISPEERQRRMEQYFRPYHAHIAERIAEICPKLLVSLHSFTPQLSTRPEEVRPWEIGILYNNDDRAARIAIPALEKQGAIVGDQLPYSGKLLNATMNLHGERNGIAYLGIEMRQDLIRHEAGQRRWAKILAPVIRAAVAGVST